MKLLDQQAAGISFRRFILTVVISAALGTVIPLEQWNGGSHNAFQISSAFAQTPTSLPVNAANAWPDGGNGYGVTQNFGTPPDTSQGIRSTLRLFENGKELGPAHSLHAAIRTLGMGRFSHWGASDGSVSLYFSASDNTNPGTNGRLYTYLIDSQPAPTTPPPTPPSLFLTVNGSSAPITVAAGSTITFSMQNAPGAATDCVTVDFTDFRDWVSSGYQHKFFAWVTGSTMTWSFSMPSGPGPYAARYWQGCATQLAISPTVTVGSLPPTPPPVASPPPSPSACSTGCFYVSPTGDDSNPGTQAAPWRTISKAVAALTAGQTAVVRDGVYEESGIAFRNTSGTASAPIVLMGENQWSGPGTGTQPTAVLSSRSGCSPAIGVYANYVTIQDIRITVSPNNVTCTTLTTNIPAAIRGWANNFPQLGGVQTSDFSHFTARRVYVDYTPNMAIGIKVSIDYSLVENCEIHNSLEDMNDLGTIFRNNVLYEHDVFGSTLYAKGGSRNFQAYNNVIHMTGSGWTEGLLLGGSSGGQWQWEPNSGIECYNCVAYNNVVINETGLSRDVFVMAGCKDCTFLNNIGINGLTTTRGGGGNPNTTTNPTWRNNILTIPSDPGLTADWHLAAGSGYQGAGIAMPTVPAYGGGTIDVSKNKDDVTRTEPWNLGVY